MKCPNCGKTVPEDAKVCGFCGTKIEKAGKKHCTNCGKQIPANAKVCGYCGTKVAGPAKEAPAPAAKEKPAKAAKAKERKPIPRNLLIIGGIVVGVVIVAVVLVSLMNNGGPPMVTGLGGTWSGQADNANSGEFTITFVLENSCRLNEVCGTYEIPDFPLSGDTIFTKIEGNRYQFITTRHDGQPGESTYDYLELQSDGSLFYHSEGSYGVSEGVLTKQ